MKNNITINCQSSIRIQDQDNKIIYFDPYKIAEEKHDADLIFITHDHYDHFDLKSIQNIAKENTKIIIPKSIEMVVLASGLKESMLIPVEEYQTYSILGYQVETIPSYNINKSYHPKEKHYLGYIITIQNERIYIAGDTDLTKDAENVKCDIALVPIGGTFTMNVEEAYELLLKIKPKIAIPTHYHCVVGTLEDGEKLQRLLKGQVECLLLITD